MATIASSDAPCCGGLTEEPIEPVSSCGAPAARSCCDGETSDDQSSLADTSNDAPAQDQPRRAPGGCDCPLCFCGLTTIQLAIASPMNLEFAGICVVRDDVARVLTPQVFGADLFHPPSA